MSRMKLTLDKPLIVRRFSNELRNLVKEVSSNLRPFFEDSINGELGQAHRDIVMKLFDEWCHRNDVASLNDLHETLADRFKHIIELQEEERRREIDDLVKNVADGIRSLEVERIRTAIAECMADVITSKCELEEAAWACATRLLENYISLFLDQTAHVVCARLLIYRVMEDEGYAPEKLINAPSNRQFDSLKALIEIRREYEALLPNIYALNEFDWWYVPDTKRGLLSKEEKDILARHENVFRWVLNRVIGTLANYDLSDVNFDIWREIYQHYLPEEERQRLGGFYTPYELVSMIIDLAGYKSEVPNLCKMKVLDPACGSGTFMVEVARRLINHLESEHDCHDLPPTRWEKSRFILESVKENVYAVDIHPFATFLASLNLTMLLLKHYLEVKHQDPEYRLELNVITADSLMKIVPPDISKFFTNSRLKEAHQKLERYKRILSMKFDYVFGNPPWGSVLKGPLSPLWNPERREEYKKRYGSASGKYDVYVLFLERGIEWLREGGVLGMVVNNRFLTRTFGKNIREIISNDTHIKYIIDLSEYGQELFPEATNYPVVVILKKRGDERGKSR